MNLLNKLALQRWEIWEALEFEDSEKYHNLVVSYGDIFSEISDKSSIIWNLR